MKCRHCDAEIVFIEMESGKKMPCDEKLETFIVFSHDRKGNVVKGYRTHWASCPGAEKARKR